MVHSFELSEWMNTHIQTHQQHRTQYTDSICLYFICTFVCTIMYIIFIVCLIHKMYNAGHSYRNAQKTRILNISELISQSLELLSRKIRSGTLWLKKTDIYFGRGCSLMVWHYTGDRHCTHTEVWVGCVCHQYPYQFYNFILLIWSAHSVVIICFD